MISFPDTPSSPTINPPWRLVARFAAFAVRWVLGALGVAMLIIVVSVPSRAETTLELYRECTGSSIGQVGCMGYLRGFWDGMEGASLTAIGQDIFCSNDPATAGMMREAFIEWVWTHRSTLPANEDAAVYRTFRHVFPCQ